VNGFGASDHAANAAAGGCFGRGPGAPSRHEQTPPFPCFRHSRRRLLRPQSGRAARDRSALSQTAQCDRGYPERPSRCSLEILERRFGFENRPVNSIQSRRSRTGDVIRPPASRPVRVRLAPSPPGKIALRSDCAVRRCCRFHGLQTLSLGDCCVAGAVAPGESRILHEPAQGEPTPAACMTASRA
jgi:hypothetical protein